MSVRVPDRRGRRSSQSGATNLVLESEATAAGLRGRATSLVSERPPYIAPDEPTPGIDYTEGAVRSVTVNAFERNRRARERCLVHFGRNCAVCGFSFESRYGDVVAGYIQVHHVVPLATVRKSYRLDPIRDLRPVCPNCHAVIHRRERAFRADKITEGFERTSTLACGCRGRRRATESRRPSRDI